MRILPIVAGLSAATTLQVLSCVAKASEKGNALFTLYYVDEVKFIAKGGKTGKVQSTDGKWFKYRVSPADHRNAHVPGTAYVEAADGRRIVANFVRVGV